VTAELLFEAGVLAVSAFREAGRVEETPGLASWILAGDRLATEMVESGKPSDAIELVVVDERGQVVPRPGTH
jgi:hypothetical protein